MKSLETKKVIREQLLKKRELLLKEERALKDEIIFQRVIELEEYQLSDSILLYVNYRSEVSTYKILTHSLELNKKVYCPKVISDTEMKFYRIFHIDDLQKGYQGILEPIQNEHFFKGGRTLMILPMAGFDKKMNRLGYGKGYYDRFLEKNKEIRKLGISFECQKWEKILPYESTDVPLDMIITEVDYYELGEK